MKYMNQLKPEIKSYFAILEPDFPDWLNDYIETPELLHQQYISMTCGTIYTKLFPSLFFYSSLDHSIAVALIVWHFTHDKKQTLAGLFHDIATPAFKHCIDFLNQDYMTQESTEDLTTEIIQNSKPIMSLLNRDHILLDEVDDYHKYPIADNDTPRLSADRLEYSLSNSLFTYRLLDESSIQQIYQDIFISTNENQTPELAFHHVLPANKFVKATGVLSVIYRDERTCYSMQFIADIIKGLQDEGKISIPDLYILKESDIIDMIQNSKYASIYQIWLESKKVKTSLTEPSNVYFVHHPTKMRYIDPLIQTKRASLISKRAKNNIAKNMAYQMDKYVYLDFKLPRM